MPGPGLPFSLCYLVEDDRGGVHVVDPGSPGEKAAAALDAALAAIGRRPSDVVSIVATHLHADHAGGAARLRECSGAPVLMHEREAEAIARLADGAPALDLAAWGVPAERRPELLAAAATPPGAGIAAPTATLTDGDLLDIPGRRLRVLATPGHTAGSICLDDEADGLLFTGDTVLPTVNSGIGLGGPIGGSTGGGDPIADYLGSLRIVAALDREALPGHERPFATLRERCAELERHHLSRRDEVAAQVREHPDATVWEVASALTWTGGWEALAGFALLSALAQTSLHRLSVLAGRMRPSDGRGS